MATFKETGEILLASLSSNIVEDNNLEFPYYNYPSSNFQSKTEAECRAKFSVEKQHIPVVEGILQIPQFFVCDQGTVCEGTEGLCMLLKFTTVP